jgi:LPXTG-site transpeptidase (sortase) family protein
LLHNKKFRLFYIASFILILIIYNVTLFYKDNKEKKPEHVSDEHGFVEVQDGVSQEHNQSDVNNYNFSDMYSLENFGYDQNINDIGVLENSNDEVYINYDWQLSIPQINLIAPIEEGTEEDILNRAIGHFSHTSILEGNVGICAHNRGYPVNYFANLKYLKIGNEIEYRALDEIKMYKVISMKIIEEIDWSYLEETEENILTLITCIENNPSKRLCVQAVEFEKIIKKEN